MLNVTERGIVAPLATRVYTERDGSAWFFGAIDHASDDIVAAFIERYRPTWPDTATVGDLFPGDFFVCRRLASRS